MQLSDGGRNCTSEEVVVEDEFIQVTEVTKTHRNFTGESILTQIELLEFTNSPDSDEISGRYDYFEHPRAQEPQCY